MNEHDLNSALKALGEDIRAQEPSEGIRAVLEAEVRMMARRRRLRLWLPAAAVAAVLILGVYVSRREPAEPPPGKAQAAKEFLAVPGAPAITDGYSHVIRVRLPSGEMRRFGFPVREEAGRALVDADVLVGRDGLARAVRFVPGSQSR